jgi:hypothetical protein
MSFVNPRKITENLIKIFSDNKVYSAEWRHLIPMLLVQNALPTVINAKLLADGINEKIEIYNVEIPAEVINPQEHQKEWFLDLTGDGIPDYHAVVPEREEMQDPRPDQPIWMNGRLVNE